MSLILVKQTNGLQIAIKDSRLMSSICMKPNGPLDTKESITGSSKNLVTFLVEIKAFTLRDYYMYPPFLSNLDMIASSNN